MARLGSPPWAKLLSATLAALALASSSASCFAQRDAGPTHIRVYVPPPALDDGWESASLDAVGMDAGRMTALTEALASGALPSIHGVLIARDGRLVYEAYRPGRDFKWGRPLGTVDFDRDTLHDLRSITKSVTATLVGAALESGALPAIDTPVLALLGERAGGASADKRRITLRHALTMSTGLRWDESTHPYSDPRNSETAMYLAADPIAYVLEQELIDSPGSSFVYSGGATALLGAAIEQATGMRLDAYAETALFGPLGVESYEWVKYRDGTPIGASGLRLRPRDLAKIGHLYLHGGAWDGTRVLSPQWIAASTQPHVRLGEREGYGYQWWTYRIRAKETTVDAFAAQGNGGQRLFVAPALRLMVVVTAGHYDAEDRALTSHPWHVFTRYALAAAGVEPE